MKAPIDNALANIINAQKSLSKRVRILETTEYQSIGGGGGLSGDYSNVITVFKPSDQSITQYEYTNYGFDLALGAAVGGDLIYIGAGTLILTSVKILPSSVYIAGAGVGITTVYVNGNIQNVFVIDDSNILSDFSIEFISTNTTQSYAIDSDQGNVRNLNITVTGAGTITGGITGTLRDTGYQELFPSIENVHILVTGCGGTVNLSGINVQEPPFGTMGAMRDITATIYGNTNTGLSIGIGIGSGAGGYAYLFNADVSIETTTETRVYGFYLSEIHAKDCHARIVSDDSGTYCCGYATSGSTNSNVFDNCTSKVIFTGGDGNENVCGMLSAVFTPMSLYNCHFEVADDGSALNSCGIYHLSGLDDVYAYGCTFIGSDYDIRMSSDAMYVYACQYDTFSGTVDPLSGDIAGLGVNLWHSGTVHRYPFTAAGLIAANTAAVSGDIVYIPAGTITLTAAITIAAGVTWRGEGRDNTIITATANITTFITTGIASTIEDMTIDFTCQSDAETNVYAIYATQSIFRNINVFMVEDGTVTYSYGIACYQLYYGDGTPAFDNVTIDVSGTDDSEAGANGLVGLAAYTGGSDRNCFIRDVHIKVENETHQDLTGCYLYNAYSSSTLIGQGIIVNIVNNYDGSAAYGMQTVRAELMDSHVYIYTGDIIYTRGIYHTTNSNMYGCSVNITMTDCDGTQDVTGIEVYDAEAIYSSSVYIDTDGSVDDDYGLLISNGDVDVLNSSFVAPTNDLYTSGGTTIYVYACRYATTGGAGTISYLTGDRASVDGDNDFSGDITFEGLVTFNDSGGATADVRAETDNEENMIFLDVSEDELYLGGTTNGIQIIQGGDFIFLGTSGLCYGSMYTNSAIAVTMTLASTFYELDAATAWTTGLLNNCTFADPEITVTYAGTYRITYNLSGSVGTANQVLNIGIMIDSTTVQNQGRSRVDYRNAARILNVSGTAIVTLTAGQTVSLAVRNVTSAGKVYTVQNGNLELVMVGG